MAALPMTLNDLEGHIVYVKTFLKVMPWKITCRPVS